jgi:hypothetical protein
VWRGTGPLHAGPSCLILRSSYAYPTGAVSGCRLAENPGLGASRQPALLPMRWKLEQLSMLPLVSPVHRPPDRSADPGLGILAQRFVASRPRLDRA